MSAPAPRKCVVWAGRIAILLLPVVLLAATEVAVRLLGVEERISAALVIPQWLEPDQLAQKTWLHELAETDPEDLRAFYSSYVRDRFLFWRLRPNLRLESGRRIGRKAEARDVGLHWTLDTNERGFRGPVYGYDKPDGIFRVVCAGDSSTYGWGLAYEHSYPACLQRLLDRTYGAGRFEVVSLGVPGYTSFQGHVLLDREGLRYQPDFVTIGYGANDGATVGLTQKERYETALSWVGATQELLSHSQAYGALRGVLLRLTVGNLKGRLAAVDERRKQGKTDITLEEYAGLLAHMIDAAKSKGAGAMTIIQCIPYKMKEKRDVVRTASDAAGVACLDLTELYRFADERVMKEPRLKAMYDGYTELFGEKAVTENPRLRYIMPDKCHPNALLSELVAEEIHGVMAKEPRFRSFVGEAR